MERILLSALFLLFGTMGTEAADQIGSRDNPVEIPDSTVVTSTRFSQKANESIWPVGSIPGSDLIAASSLSDAIDGKMGVDIRQLSGTGSLATLSNWGTFNRHMLLLYDGRVVRDYSLGGFNLSEFSNEEFERVELLKGPQSAIYGAEALGGVVNLRTPSSLKDKLSLISRLGSNDSRMYRVDLSRSFGFYGLGGFTEYESSENSRDNAGVERFVAGIRSDFLSDDGRNSASISTRYFNDSLGVPGPEPDKALIPADGNESAYSLYDHQVDENYSVDARYRFYDERLGEAHVDIFWEKKNLEFNSLYRDFSGNKVFGKSTINKRSSGMSGRLQKESSIGTFAGGVDYLSGSIRATQDDRTDFVDSSSSSYNFWSGAQDQVDTWGRSGLILMSGTRLDLSGRLQFVHNREMQTSYNLGILLDVSENTRFKGGYGYAFRLPSLYDQFADGFFVKGNSRLNPETSHSLVATAEIGNSTGSRSFSVSLFNQKVDSLIQYVFDNSTFKSIPSNIGQFRSRGIDITGKFSPGEKNVLDFSMVYQKAEQTGSDGTTFQTAFYVPDLKYRIGWNSLLTSKIVYALAVNYTADRQIIMFGGDKKVIGEVYELSASLTGNPMSNMTITLSGEDLTDQARPDQFGFSKSDGDYPSLGRRLYLRISYKAL